MSTVDKNQAIIKYLSACPQIKNNPLFFNFINAKDNDKQIVTTATDKATSKAFIDGSVQKRYTFTIIDYRSVIYQPIVKKPGYPNENVEELMDVQGIIDWITEQNYDTNFPDFGNECIIDSIEALSENPSLNGVDTSVSPPLAKYSIAIRVDYLDLSRSLY